MRQAGRLVPFGSATMKSSNARACKAAALVFALAAAGCLAGCETDGNSPGPFAALSSPAKPAEPEKPPEPPMTHARAASECWMSTEKGSASVNIDKRADIVDKCIENKMKTAPKS
jgi:hypothetical protein